MLDKLRYLKSIGSDQLIFLMGLFFVILAIMILRYTLKHPRLGAEGKHKIMRIGLFISIAALAFCGVCYMLYMAHENILMKRFDENKDSVVQHIKDMLPDLNLTGQWSLDVMQNGNDFYIIDMALAAESALKNYVPKGRLHPVKEDWIPELVKRDCYK